MLYLDIPNLSRPNSTSNKKALTGAGMGDGVFIEKVIEKMIFQDLTLSFWGSLRYNMIKEVSRESYCSYRFHRLVREAS
jgi:hypothetical protein